MPRCYMVKKNGSKHHDWGARSPCSPTEASVAPPCYSPPNGQEIERSSQPGAPYGVSSWSGESAWRTTNVSPLEGRSVEETEAAHDLLSLAQSLPPLPPPAVLTILHPAPPPPVAAASILLSCYQPTQLYLVTEPPPPIAIAAPPPLNVPTYVPSADYVQLARAACGHRATQTAELAASPISPRAPPAAARIAPRVPPAPVRIAPRVPPANAPIPPPVDVRITPRRPRSAARISHRAPPTTARTASVIRRTASDTAAAAALTDLSVAAPVPPVPPVLAPVWAPPPPDPPSPSAVYTYDALLVADGRSRSRKRESERRTPPAEAGAARPPRFICSECGKQYATSSNLSRHKQTHRSLDSVAAKRCAECGKAYVSMPALAMHLLTHQLAHVCGVCGKLFSRPWLLQGHLRSHTGEKPYGCAHCGKTFADRSNLRAHMQTHSADKNHECLRCHKTFALKSYLNKHRESACVREGEAEGEPGEAALEPAPRSSA